MLGIRYDPYIDGILGQGNTAIELEEEIKKLDEQIEKAGVIDKIKLKRKQSKLQKQLFEMNIKKY